MSKHRKIIVLVFALLFIVLSASSEKVQEELSIVFFDFPEFYAAGEKSGDMILLRFPDDTVMMIDGGVRKAGPLLVKELQQLGIEKIDYLVLTHPHSDHYGGFVGEAGLENGILHHFKISTLITPPFPESRASEFFALINSLGIEKSFVLRGDTLTIGDVVLSIMNPGPEDDFISDLNAATNNASLVMKLTYGHSNILFTGDLYSKQELRLVQLYGQQLESQLLKVPHHGYDTSSTKVFIEAVNPEAAIALGSIKMETFQKRTYDKNNVHLLFTYSDGTIVAKVSKDYIVITNKDGELLWESAVLDKAS